MRGLACHFCALMASMRGLYLSCLFLMAWFVYLSCVNVSSIGWIVGSGFGVYGAGGSCGAPWIYIMFGCRFARHEHFVVGHVHCSIQGAMVVSCKWLFSFSLATFVSV